MSQSARSSKQSIKFYAIFCHASISGRSSGDHIDFAKKQKSRGEKSNYKRIKDASGYFIVGADQRRKKFTIINYYHSKIKE